MRMAKISLKHLKFKIKYYWWFAYYYYNVQTEMKKSKHSKLKHSKKPSREKAV